MKKKLFQTDWLASETVFYNVKTSKVSSCIHDVIDYSNLEIDPEGFNNYLNFGYSILERTPIKHVKFVPHSSRLYIDEHGTLSVEYLEDPIDGWLDKHYSESEIFELIQSKITEWETSHNGEIIIPTSGGYDSRLLNYFIKDKSRIRSFTYGISHNQHDSFEVVYAKRLSEILGTQWEQITLGNFHNYLEDWDCLFGPSTHAHGMYHIEFYSKILPLVRGNNPLLSGIIGDAWAGSVSISLMENWEKVVLLGYSHGINSDSTHSKFKTPNNDLKNYWEKNENRLKDERIRIIESMRFKIRLLSYLMIIPRQFGFKPWSPFLDIEVAMAMLNLPSERRKNRVWMREFYEQHGLNFESMNLKASRQNVLDLYALSKNPVTPLDISILQEVIDPDYISWINENVNQDNPHLKESFHSIYKKNKFIQILLNLTGIKTRNNHSNQLNAYSAYLVILPIERILKKRTNRGDTSR